MAALEPPSAHPPQLVLHLDVNKTLIMTDPAAKASIDDLLNGVLASSAFGRVVHESPPRWMFDGSCLSGVPAEPGSSSYYSFVKDIQYPYRSISSGAAVSADELEEHRAFNQRQKEAARARLTRFTAPGEAGHQFAPVFEALKTKLSVPADKMEACVASGLCGLSAGNIFLLPSYFKLLEHLLSRGEHDPSFLLVFRTFGTDSAHVIAEHNAWVAGTHPLFTPAAAIAPVVASLAVECPSDTGAISRSGLQSKDTRLAAVVGQRDWLGWGRQSASREAGPAQRAPPMVRMVTGFRDIHDHLAAHLPPSGGRVMALQDDYHFWFAASEHGDHGKLLPLDCSACGCGGAAAAASAGDGVRHLRGASHGPQTPIYSLFLDDNVGSEADAVAILHPHHVGALPLAARLPGAAEGPGDVEAACTRSEPAKPAGDDHAGIVACVDIRSGKPLPMSVVRNVHVARVDPLSAILNEDYFVELLQLCEANWRARVASRGAS